MSVLQEPATRRAWTRLGVTTAVAALGASVFVGAEAHSAASSTRELLKHRAELAAAASSLSAHVSTFASHRSATFQDIAVIKSDLDWQAEQAKRRDLLKPMAGCDLTKLPAPTGPIDDRVAALLRGYTYKLLHEVDESTARAMEEFARTRASKRAKSGLDAFWKKYPAKEQSPVWVERDQVFLECMLQVGIDPAEFEVRE